jgi:hypothetical protein
MSSSRPLVRGFVSVFICFGAIKDSPETRSQGTEHDTHAKATNQYQTKVYTQFQRVRTAEIQNPRVEASSETFHLNWPDEVRVPKLHWLLSFLCGWPIGSPELLGFDANRTVLQGVAFPVGVYLALGGLLARVVESLVQDLFGRAELHLAVGKPALHFVKSVNHARPQDDLPWTGLRNLAYPTVQLPPAIGGTGPDTQVEHQVGRQRGRGRPRTDRRPHYQYRSRFQGWNSHLHTWLAEQVLGQRNYQSRPQLIEAYVAAATS